MIKHLFSGMFISIGWYLGQEFCEIAHRKICVTYRDQEWYRNLYSQPKEVCSDIKAYTSNNAYGFRAPLS